MGRWMRSVDMVRAYSVSTLVYTVPILVGSIAVVLYLSSANDRVTQIQSQVDQAAQSGRVHPRQVTVEPDFDNIIPEWALVILLAALAGGTYTRRALTNQLVDATDDLVQDARAAAGGDLRVDPPVTLGNEYGSLQAGVKAMLNSFRTTISRIDRAADDLSQASSEMTHTSDEAGHAIGEVAQAVSSISEGAQHQVTLVASASGVVAEIERAIRDTSEHAREAQRQSADTERLTEEGVQRAAEVQEAMQAVRENSIETASVIRQLGAKSSDIDHIVQAITDIAQQTNMLALNAAIEAARAGESGRGFANVAEEVRMLADDAGRSAEEISGLVRQIQDQTAEAVAAMEQGVSTVEEGFETVNRNRQTFYDISAAVRNLHEGSAEISELADGIALGASQVREQIEEVASVAEQSSASTEQVSASTQQTSASAQEVSESAQRVAQTAYNLAELAGRFQLPASALAKSRNSDDAG
ncbi:MAG: methyl-accepting chemotaxis protein [Solirubrobacterales bacterium]